MKRIGMIIALAFVLIVGGVYATFSYAKNDVGTVNTALNKSIAESTTTVAKGTVAVDVDGFTVRVDDKGVLDGGSGTLVTGYKSQGTVNLTFTPAKGADQEVVDGGVNLKMEIAFENNRYNGTDIFKTTTAYPTTGIILGKGTKNDVSGKFEYTVDLAPYLAVNEISLPTNADYNSFLTAFTNAKIKITVSEVK